MRQSSAMEMDAVVVGFGPAGIALCCALDDWIEAHGGSPAGQMLFLEKSADTTWHGGFLLDGTDINHHIFRDLVTPRDPRSRFSFAMYLKAHNRLYKFGLLGRPPSRKEWSDYLSWAAAQLSQYVSYNEEVEAIAPVTNEGQLQELMVLTNRGTYLTRNVVLSSGSQAKTPDVLLPYLGRTVFHTSAYLPRIAEMGRRLPRRWLVLGSGQSAGETISDLLRRHPDIVIDSVHRSSGFRIGQLGQFPNLAFLPEQVDYFHGLDPASRNRLFADVKATNYAGIDVDESSALYSQIYEDSINGKERLRMHIFSDLLSVVPQESEYEVVLRDIFSGQSCTLVVDAIVLGTGYEQPRIPPILAELLPWLQLAQDGGLLIDRDYRIALNNAAPVGLFANGLSERAHGISDAQSFSLVAMRADRILCALMGQVRQPTDRRISLSVAG